MVLTMGSTIEYITMSAWIGKKQVFLFGFATPGVEELNL